MKIIDGKKLATKIEEELKQEIFVNNLTPGLAIILVGNNSASEIYVRNKLVSCEKIGIDCNLIRFSEFNTELEIIDCINNLNNNNSIDGIIVQSPLPPNLNEYKIMNAISKEKDVDGFGNYNLGATTSGKEFILAATPKGIIKLLENEDIEIAGKNVVIIGRSKIVSRPLAMALLNKDATVTIVHTKTKDLKSITKTADILIVAIGSPNFITADFIKTGAVIIDVGINRVNNKLCGDVDFENVKSKVSYITPVPGGVGPMTIAMLLSNVVENAKKKEGEN